MTNENFVLDNRRHLLLALSQPQTALEVGRLDAAHERPEIRHALVRHDVLVVAVRKSGRSKRVQKRQVGWPMAITLL